MSNHILLKANVDLGIAKKDQIVRVLCDENKVPLELFWRNRLADSTMDKCVSIVEDNDKISSEKKDARKKTED